MKAYFSFRKSNFQALDETMSFDTFCSKENKWLDDYATYRVFRERSHSPWYKWSHSIKTREDSALSRKKDSFKEEISREKFNQYLFFVQWHKLKCYCEKRNVHIFGDLSFYIDHDSADVWSHPELFKLDKHEKMEFVGGVPPDYFSKNGQLWGTPVYNWRQHRKTGFEWWLDRISHNLKLCDALRLDHFRGFVAYCQVSGHSKTARFGSWRRTPTKSFFRAARQRFPELTFVAEDLGLITKPVKNLLKDLGLPGMRVLLFAFDDAKNNPNLPENINKNCVAYTSTHDTNNVKGWFTEEATHKMKKKLFQIVGRSLSESEVSAEFMRLALASDANLCVIPFQDLLSLGSEARMNNPSKSIGNWSWRATTQQMESEKLATLLGFTVDFKRAF